MSDVLAHLRRHAVAYLALFVALSGSALALQGVNSVKSDDIDTHTKTSTIRLHSAATGPDGKFAREDQLLSMEGEPGHQELCDLEQAFLLKAIRENIDLTRHMDDAVKSLAVCLAADESVRSGKAVKL